MSGTQLVAIFLGDDAADESKNLMSAFMKESFPNTVKSCKWRTSTTKRAQFMFDVKPASTNYEVDLLCVNGNEATLIGEEFKGGDGTHRDIEKEKIQGFIVIGALDDPKDKKYKQVVDEVNKRIAVFKKEKALGAKDNDFIIGVQNNVEGFDSAKLAKKLKDDKIGNPAKTFFAGNTPDMLTQLVKVLSQ